MITKIVFFVWPQTTNIFNYCQYITNVCSIPVYFDLKYIVQIISATSQNIKCHIYGEIVKKARPVPN